MSEMIQLILLQVAGIRSTTEGGRVLRKLCGGRSYCERVLSTGESVSRCCHISHKLCKAAAPLADKSADSHADLPI